MNKKATKKKAKRKTPQSTDGLAGHLARIHDYVMHAIAAGWNEIETSDNMDEGDLVEAREVVAAALDIQGFEHMISLHYLKGQIVNSRKSKATTRIAEVMRKRL